MWKSDARQIPSMWWALVMGTWTEWLDNFRLVAGVLNWVYVSGESESILMRHTVCPMSRIHKCKWWRTFMHVKWTFFRYVKWCFPHFNYNALIESTFVYLSFGGCFSFSCSGVNVRVSCRTVLLPVSMGLKHLNSIHSMTLWNGLHMWI